MGYEKILHISDLHIRAGDSIVSRFDEYSSQFDRLIKVIQTYDIETTLIGLTGDIFHDKSKIGPSAQMLMQKLLNGIRNYNVVAIRGNHDYRQDQPDEPDLLKPFFDEASEKHQYLDETGLYEFKDIEIGIVAVQDTLVRGAGSGINQTLPEFPMPSENDPNIKHRVALFHGSFGGAFLQNGTNVDDRSNYPVNGWIKGYDILLFGDIHVQQVHRASVHAGTKEKKPLLDFTSTEKKSLYVSGHYTYDEKNVPWSYSGSVIQQNFGENIWGHGFSEWNLNKKEVTFYHLPNTFGYIIVILKDNEPCVKVRIDGRVVHFPIQLIVTFGWFPTRISLRLSSAIRHLFKQVQETFASCNIVVQDSGFIEESAIENDISTVSHNSQSSLEGDLTTLNSEDTWVNYFMENKKMESGEWTQWIHHPHMLKTPEDIYSPTSLEKIKERNSKFGKLVENYLHSKDTKPPVRRLRIHKIEFAWLLCFGEENWMDFDQFQKQICLINGNNGSGKSAFLEVLCIALYGESFPSRSNKSYSASIINQQREKGKHSYTNICFSIDGKKYWIHRAFDFQQKNAKTLMQRSVYLMENDTREVIKQSVVQVDKWVEEYIGSFKHFLLTTIMSQNNDSDFFQMSTKEQKGIIDSLLQLNVCEEFRAILKEAKNDHIYALSQLTAFEEGTKSGMVHFNTEDSNIPFLEQRKIELDERIEKLKTEKDDLKIAFMNIAEREFQTPLATYQANLASIQIVKVDIDYAEAKAKRAKLRDRMAVLKTKPYPIEAQEQKPLHPDLSFDILEQRLIQARNERLPYGKAKKYDERVFTDWLSKYNEYMKNSEKSSQETVQDLEKQLHALYAERDTYEIDDDFKPVSEKELLKLRKKDEGFQVKIADIEQDIRSLTKEQGLLESSLTPIVKKVLKEYISARNDLEIGFAPPSEANERIGQATIKQKLLQGLQREKDYTLQQLEDVGSVQYNPKCNECIKNPFRHKKEALLQEKSRIEKEYEDVEKDILIILKDKPFDTVVTLYQRWQSLHSSKIEKNMEESSRLCIVRKDIEQLQGELQLLSEKREENGYENQELINTYFALLDQIKDKEAEKQYAVFQEEKRNWENVKFLNEMDEKISKIETETIQYFTNEYVTVDKELHTLNESITQYEKMKEDTIRMEKYKAICDAYPCWTKYKLLDTEYASCTKEVSMYSAQLQQALLWKKKQEESIQILNRIQAFHKVLEDRTNYVTQLYTGFEDYTKWLYPSKVKPVIEQAVNTILASISLPRPIQLKADWEDDHFNWIVLDGSSSPPYEKCSGSQRFFISLALRFAFSRMGTSNMINAQMFLDEGFTACDAETMDRVPDLLKNIVHNLEYLQTIFIVSHLDQLKSVANRSIGILRNNANSKICFGEKPILPKKI